MTRRRILALHQGGALGGLYGSDRVFLETIKAIAGDTETTVVLETDGPLADRLRRLPVEVRVRHLGMLRRRDYHALGIVSCMGRTARAALWLRSIIRRQRIEVVYTNTIGLLAGALAARLSGCEHVWHIHEILIRPRLVAMTLYQLVARLSTRVVANSRATAAHVASFAPTAGSKTAVVWNGVAVGAFDAADGAALRSELGLEPATVLIGYVGRLHFLKGLEVLVAALARVEESAASPFHLVIAGDVYPGYEDLETSLRAEVDRLAIGHRVDFLGRREDVADLHKALDLLVAPSTWPESFCLSVAEAMAAGRPAIATDHGGTSELVVEGVTGFLVPPGDSTALAERILELMEDRELRLRMGGAARRRLESEFSDSRFRDGIRTVLLRS